MDKPSQRHRAFGRAALALWLLPCGTACGGPSVSPGQHSSDGIATPSIACGPPASLESAPAPGDPVSLTLNNHASAAREVSQVAADGSTALLGEVAAGQALTVKVQPNTVVLVGAGGRCLVATRAAAGINHFSIER
jgi:hypothetical protein